MCLNEVVQEKYITLSQWAVDLQSCFWEWVPYTVCYGRPGLSSTESIQLIKNNCDTVLYAVQ